MRRRLSVPIALVLLSLGGCTGGEPPATDALVEIAGPDAFLSLELRDGSDEVLWRLVATEPVPLERVVYGEVPAGFRQEAPANGRAPRPLDAGEPLSLESFTPRWQFHHLGFATDTGRFTIDHWTITLRQPPSKAASPGAPVDGAAPDS